MTTAADDPEGQARVGFVPPLISMSYAWQK
jgi:hypothetical protein